MCFSIVYEVGDISLYHIHYLIPAFFPLHFHQAKAKEERQEKCGEDEDTAPAEYRLKPAKDKDGKPLLPEPEETSTCLSESVLIGELSADFG